MSSGKTADYMKFKSISEIVEQDLEESPSKEERLMHLCKSFIRSQGISGPDSICQCDMIYEHSPEFIEEICKIVGYHKN